MRHRIAAAIPALSYLVCAGSANAQRLGQGQEDPVSMWRVLGALSLCIALAVTAALAMRSRRFTNLKMPGFPMLTPVDRQLKLIETLRLPNDASLCLISCKGRSLILLTSRQGVQQVQLAYPTAGVSPNDDRDVP